jgi:hypothetical protein
MKGFILKNCTNSNAHTRPGSCPTFQGRPAGLIFTSRNALFSTDPDTFNQEIREAIYASGQKIKDRATPVMQIANMAASGGDLQTSQEGWGGTQFTGLNEVREDYTIVKGGNCLYKQLSKLNDQEMRVFKIDNKGMIFGTVTEVEGVEKFRGYELSTIGTYLRPAADNAAAIMLSLVYSANLQQESIDSHAFELSGDEIEGLWGIQLKKTAAGKAQVVEACSGEDLTAIFGNSLANANIYLNKTGGNPTAVTFANGVLTFTPAGAYRIADAATLKAANIEGYEGEEDYIDIS